MDIRVRLGVEDLIGAYAAAIDEDRLEDWPPLFVEACRYRIVPRADFEEGLPYGVISADSRAMLEDRVTALRKANIYEPHGYRHIVGPIRVIGVEDDVAEVRSNFIAMRIMKDGTTTLFATGEYRDRIAVADEPFRFVERIVVTDSQRFDTLLALPL